MNYSKAADRVLAHISKPLNNYCLYTAKRLRNDLFPFKRVSQIEDLVAWMSNQERAEAIATFTGYAIVFNENTLAFIAKGGFEALPNNPIRNTGKSSPYAITLKQKREEIARQRKARIKLLLKVAAAAIVIVTVYFLYKYFG